MEFRRADLFKGGKRQFRFLRNKYAVALLLFAIWVMFIDQNNLVERFQLMREKKQLHQDKSFYVDKKEQDAERLRELKTNDENLEKFAREQYLMKKENEDVFVIIEE